MSLHLDEFHTADLTFDNCSISSTISHQIRNWIFYRLPNGTVSKYRSVYLSCSVCIQDKLLSKFVPMLKNFYISYKFAISYQHFTCVNIHILWFLHLQGQLFQQDLHHSLVSPCSKQRHNVWTDKMHRNALVVTRLRVKRKQFYV